MQTQTSCREILAWETSKGHDLSRHLQESSGPPGPKSQTSLKEGLFEGPWKYRKSNKLKNSPKRPKMSFDFKFWSVSADPPKDSFETRSAFSGAEATETPINGGSGRNQWGDYRTQGRQTSQNTAPDKKKSPWGETERSLREEGQGEGFLQCRGLLKWGLLERVFSDPKLMSN